MKKKKARHIVASVLMALSLYIPFIVSSGRQFLKIFSSVAPAPTNSSNYLLSFIVSSSVSFASVPSCQSMLYLYSIPGFYFILYG